MTQPTFVPITDSDQVRPSFHLESASHVVGKLSEVHTPQQPEGNGLGFHGPDQGYALTLAKRMAKKFVLTPGENSKDVQVGVAMIAGRRAAIIGRAPTVYDLEVALGIFGFLMAAPDDLVAYRKGVFQSLSHNYVSQRDLVDQIPDATLKLTPQEVESPRADWRELVGA